MSEHLPSPAESTLPAPVLVVEDEPLLQQRLRGVLLQLGYAPDALVFAASLAEARACLAAQPVALALVDLALPDGSGMALIAQMRADDPGLGPGGVGLEFGGGDPGRAARRGHGVCAEGA